MGANLEYRIYEDDDRAAIAAEWLKAKRVVPIHFNTFPPIAQDVAPFRERLSEKGIEVVELAKGERYAL